MSYELFSWMMFGLFVGMALMVVVRFAFYGRRENGMASVYFWGGFLSFALAAADLAANRFYHMPLHGWQSLLFLALSAIALYRALAKRRVIANA